jgi:CBS domain-containing protein
MKARDIMTSDPARVTPDTKLSAAARLMKEKDVGLLPVVEADGSSKLIGLITDRDITLKHVAAGHSSDDCTVREAMSGNPTTCSPDADVDDVMKTMGSEQVRRIPIVDERSNLVGIVSQADIALQVDDATRTDRTLEQISKPS